MTGADFPELGDVDTLELQEGGDFFSFSFLFFFLGGGLV